ncbi:hypothetical protein FACS1894181_07830 [Bacteroidia bacterium]|nr:hypothetical protein FACS1894181_07830 [Bacteroidia bacterium]
MNKIAAIIVTYNRKECLLNCLHAIRLQTLAPDIIYIVDNHSTDGTPDVLLENQYIADNVADHITEDLIAAFQISSFNNADTAILIKYVYKSENTGGAGGFYTGMKMAYDDGYEWLWMMDDDGLPAKDGLEQLFRYSNKYNLHFANALVVNINDRYSLPFFLERSKKNLDDCKGMDIIYNKITPFNGSFISRIVPEKIGFIKKEMFIWGDEREYYARSLKNKFVVGTVTKSIHYHPEAKDVEVNIFPFVNRFKVVLRSGNFFYICYRNIGYLFYTYNRVTFYRMLVSYMLYFIIRFKFAECAKFLAAYIDGSKNKFGK